MAYEINQIITGKVIKVKPFAAFLSFDDEVEGLLHISEISDSYIRDIERFVSVGDEMKVKILSIDNTNGFLRVSLKQVPPNEFYSSHVNTRKRVIKDDSDAFKPLQEKLPYWIKETLKKKEENNDD